MIFVYGLEKFVKMVWRACGRVAFLNSGVSMLPLGAVLYVESLKTAVRMKLKAPRLAVRTAAAEVEDVKLIYVNVYYMLRDVETWGTCHVYVPDDALRQALQKPSGPARIEFVEARRPTYPCASYKPGRPDPSELLREVLLDAFSRAYAEPHAHPRPVRSYTIPTGITAWALPKPGRTAGECTAVGTPLFDVDWDYYVDHPLAAPEKPAELLHRRKLFFQKAVPKPLKAPRQTPSECSQLRMDAHKRNRRPHREFFVESSPPDFL